MASFPSYGSQYPGYAAPAYPNLSSTVGYVAPVAPVAVPPSAYANLNSYPASFGFAASPGQPDSAQGTPQSAPQAAPDAQTRLVVSGCRHETVAQIVRGHFSRNGENHGCPVYKKESQWNGLDVMIYYWVRSLHAVSWCFHSWLAPVPALGVPIHILEGLSS